MIKAHAPSLSLAGAVSAQAADGDWLVGIEFGVRYHLAEDSRYDGTDINSLVSSSA